MNKAVSIISLTKERLKTKKKEKQNDSIGSEKRVSQWEEVMRKFSESRQEECRTVPLDIPRVPRSMKTFPTGSQYEGSWNVLGMSGFGVYIFPNGVIYEGEFEDGMFDGQGELRYESGVILRGRWQKGVMVERTLVFSDGLEYDEWDWKYCKAPDRRFTIEYELGLQPAGDSFITADQPTRDIPPGHYDTGDGFYNPKTKAVYKAEELTTVLRAPKIREQKWIKENCRVNPDVSTGPRPDLYETWSKPEIEPKPAPAPAATSKGGYSSFASLSSDRDLDAPFGRDVFYEPKEPDQQDRESMRSEKSLQQPTIKFDTRNERRSRLESYIETSRRSKSGSILENLIGKMSKFETWQPSKQSLY